MEKSFIISGPSLLKMKQSQAIHAMEDVRVGSKDWPQRRNNKEHTKPD